MEPGALLAGEYPGATTPDVAEARIDLLVDHGVRTFVDLTETVDGLEPYAEHVATIGARRGLDLHHRPFPIPDMGVCSAEGYDEILDAISESTDRGVVYVHCWGGIGRTSTVVGCLLVDAGLDADAALADITRRRSTTRKAHRAAPADPGSDRCHSRPRRPAPFARQHLSRTVRGGREDEGIERALGAHDEAVPAEGAEQSDLLARPRSVARSRSRPAGSGTNARVQMVVGYQGNAVMEEGLDVIGDVHGESGKLARLLATLGYIDQGNGYRYPQRLGVSSSWAI